jgi:hypothetical protein
MKALIHEKLRRHGVSVEGREWLLRCLHPASEDKSPGLPDQSAMAVLRPDFRIQATIQPPQDASSWDCLLWTPPGDVNAVYWATGPAGTNFASRTAPVAGCEVGVLRLQRSTQSTIPQILTLPDGTVVPVLTETGAITNVGFRHQFKSVTVQQIASAVADQGQVYAAQFAPNFRRPHEILLNGYDSGVPIEPPPDPPANYSLVAEQFATVLPANEGDMAAMAPDFYMGPSREGVYMPLRLAGPTQPFARASTHSTAVQAGSEATFFVGDDSDFSIGAVMTANYNSLSSNSSAVPWPFKAVSVNGMLGYQTVPGTPEPLTIPGGVLLDSGFDNINVGVMIFRGLAGSGGGAFGASLQVKCIAGLEIAPNPSASDRVFAENAAPYDPQALQAYYTIAMELQGVYPARFNGWGDIWDAIKSAVSTVYSDVVKPIATQFVEKAGPLLIDAGTRALASGGMLTGARRGAPRVTYRAPSVARSTRSASAARSVVRKTKAKRKVRAR